MLKIWDEIEDELLLGKMAVGSIGARKLKQELGNERVFKLCPGHAVQVIPPAPRDLYLGAVG